MKIENDWQYRLAMFQIEKLMKLDPIASSDEGQKLQEMASAAEEYEKKMGWCRWKA